jgi:hypothetical protein
VDKAKHGPIQELGFNSDRFFEVTQLTEIDLLICPLTFTFSSTLKKTNPLSMNREHKDIFISVATAQDDYRDLIELCASVKQEWGATTINSNEVLLRLRLLGS